MAQPVEIEVIAGTCRGEEHPVGQKWLFEGYTPGGMCLGAFYAIIPFLFALRHEAKISWANPDGSLEIKCPDPAGIVLRLKPQSQG